MTIEAHWPQIKRLFKNSFKSSLHFSIATVSKDGEPHVTPIGSLILGKPGRGLYFEHYTKKLPENLQANKQVCILAVNSSRWLWISSLLKGKFTTPPAVRLFGTVGELRNATNKEIESFQRRVKPFKLTKGHRLLWSNMTKVRDLTFTRIEPVHIGKMTANRSNEFLLLKNP